MQSNGNGWIAPTLVLSTLITIMIVVLLEVAPRADAVGAAFLLTLTVLLAGGLAFVFAHSDARPPH
jgi:hypothetical protein